MTRNSRAAGDAAAASVFAGHGPPLGAPAGACRPGRARRARSGRRAGGAGPAGAGRGAAGVRRASRGDAAGAAVGLRAARGDACQRATRAVAVPARAVAVLAVAARAGAAFGAADCAGEARGARPRAGPACRAAEPRRLPRPCGTRLLGGAGAGAGSGPRIVAALSRAVTDAPRADDPRAAEAEQREDGQDRHVSARRAGWPLNCTAGGA